jgi:hypothetical protein
MKVLELNLSEPTVTKLQEAAERLSLSPEELAILSLEEKLAQLDDQFRNAADYVLNKNAPNSISVSPDALPLRTNCRLQLRALPHGRATAPFRGSEPTPTP